MTEPMPRMAYYDENISEDSIKGKVRDEFFSPKFDCTNFPGKKVDFTVKDRKNNQYFLWAESKAGTNEDILESFIQLIITIGKLSIDEKASLPNLLGAFDAEKIAFVPYGVAKEFFQKAKELGINWGKVTPSDHTSEEFGQLLDYEMTKKPLQSSMVQFDFGKDNKALHKFIKANFRKGVFEPQKIEIEDIDDILDVFDRWKDKVSETIKINWSTVRTNNLFEADFYLADLLSDEEKDSTLKDFVDLRVLLKVDPEDENKRFYKVKKVENDQGGFDLWEIPFKDNGLEHKKFWRCFKRPPVEKYWGLNRRDLLMSQEIRERKGAFYTPPIWSKKSKEYLSEVLGKNWQEDFIVWDCCAGTGNLLDGLNPEYRHNFFASTLDTSDVQIMRKERGEKGTQQLFDDHIFQFDFLRDSIEKLPEKLQEIVRDEEKRKKLLFYINPPYAESGNRRQIRRKSEKNKSGVATNKALVSSGLKKKIGGKAAKEVFSQFFAKIYEEFSGCWLAEFSKLKNLQSDNFRKFREFFLARLNKVFIVPANTFDNVTGEFPIGFLIWNTAEKEKFKEVQADVFDADGKFLGQKRICAADKTLNDWRKTFKAKDGDIRGILMADTSDFQNNDHVGLISKKTKGHWIFANINTETLIPYSIYMAVRRSIPQTWLNDRDLFLFPNDSWKTDLEFHSDCLAFSLFDGQNRITSIEGTNHLIPFTETEVGARSRFSSHFMSDFLRGKLPPKELEDPGKFESGKLFYDGTHEVKFSGEAKAVFDAARELWKYYHSQPDSKADASFYDIRWHFRKKNDKGDKTEENGAERLNPNSDDEHFMELITELRKRLKVLAAKIEQKVYEHGFLLK